MSFLIKCAGAGLAVVVLFQAAAAETPPNVAEEPRSAGGRARLATQKDRASYAIGIEIARNFRRQKIDIDQDLVIKGIRDTLADEKLLMSDEELLATLNIFGNDMAHKRIRDKRVAALDNKKEGEDFLAANRSREGVVELPSGLQYRILQKGEGRKAEETGTAVCRYRGVLIDGTEFENTFSTSDPAVVNLSDLKVIPGLREALKLMPEGSRWQLFIPPQIAYSSQGAGRRIGPNATLIYELEVISVESGNLEAGRHGQKKSERRL